MIRYEYKWMERERPQFDPVNFELVASFEALRLLRRAHANAGKAYQRGIEEGERREREAQNQTYWADALNREGAAK